jgi:glucose-1-phosphatase
MIDTIIFDIGGVLVQTTDLAPRQKWERELGLPDWGLSDVFNNDVSRAAFVGAADAPDVWRHVARELQLDAVDTKRIAADFWAGDAVNTAHIALIESLRGRVKLGILSNAWQDMRARDASRIDFSRFDSVVYSCEERVRKPTREIYTRALDKLGSVASQTLFIDDFVENIDAARELGIHSIRYQASMDLPAAVAALLEA